MTTTAKVTRNMSEGSIWKNIVLFALPLFIGNLFQQLYNTADSLIVGNYLGSNALAAVSSSGNLIFLMTGLFQGISIGASVVIARYFGAKEYGNMNKAIHTTISFGIIGGILLTIIGYLLAPQMLKWMGTPIDVFDLSVTYFKIYFLGSLGQILYNCCVGILQAMGDSKRPLYFLIISSITNIILDLIFIAVFKLGVGSAALATIISQYLSALLCMYRLTHVKDIYQVKIKDIKIHMNIMKQIIKIGLPSGFQNSIISVGNVVVQSNINVFGELAMAGCGAYSKIEGFAFLPIMAFSMAVTTFVSQNIGAKKFDRVKKGAKFAIICSMIFAEIVGLIMFVAVPIFIAAFDNNPSVIMYGVERARTSCLFYFLLAYSHSVSGVLRGAGKSSVPMFVMMIFWCFVRVALLEIGGMFYETIWFVYLCYPLTWTLSTIVFLIYYNKVSWLE